MSAAHTPKPEMHARLVCAETSEFAQDNSPCYVCGRKLVASPTSTAPQEADALREALQWIADRRWHYVEEAVDAARAALAQHQPQQGEQE